MFMTFYDSKHVYDIMSRRYQLLVASASPPPEEYPFNASGKPLS